MKKFLGILVLGLLLQSNAYAEWKKLRTYKGTTLYVAVDTIIKKNGYVYFWDMHNNDVLDKFGVMSSQTYYQTDCSLIRVKTLSYIFYKRSMGSGPSEQQESVVKDWKYPAPNTFMRIAVKFACNH